MKNPFLAKDKKESYARVCKLACEIENKANLYYEANKENCSALSQKHADIESSLRTQISR